MVLLGCRPTLANVFLLVDASVPTQASDLESANWLVEAGVPMSIVFTKVDKRKKRVSGVDENVESFMVSPVSSDSSICPG